MKGSFTCMMLHMNMHAKRGVRLCATCVEIAASFFHRRERWGAQTKEKGLYTPWCQLLWALEHLVCILYHMRPLLVLKGVQAELGRIGLLRMLCFLELCAVCSWHGLQRKCLKPLYKSVGMLWAHHVSMFLIISLCSWLFPWDSCRWWEGASEAVAKAVPPRKLELRVHMRTSWTCCFLHGNTIGTQLLGPENPIMAVDRNVFKKKKSQDGVNENITKCFRIVGLFLWFLQFRLHTLCLEGCVCWVMFPMVLRGWARSLPCGAKCWLALTLDLS